MKSQTLFALRSIQSTTSIGRISQGFSVSQNCFYQHCHLFKSFGTRCLRWQNTLEYNSTRDEITDIISSTSHTIHNKQTQHLARFCGLSKLLISILSLISIFWYSMPKMIKRFSIYHCKWSNHRHYSQYKSYNPQQPNTAFGKFFWSLKIVHMNTVTHFSLLVLNA